MAVLLPERVRRPPVVGAVMKRVGTRLRVGSIEVCLSGCRLWRGRLRGRDVRAAAPSEFDSRGCLTEKAADLARALGACGEPGGFLGLARSEAAGRFQRELGPLQGTNPFREYAAATLRRVEMTSDPPILQGLEDLVGLGPGFTPSGDDFLAGMLLGERALMLQRAGAPRIDSERIRSTLDRSSPGGRTLLWLALRGSFPAYLLSAVRGLTRAAPLQAVFKVVEKAVAHGKTSGTDALVGLLWYLEKARTAGSRR